MGEALLWTLGLGLGDGFTPEVKAAWTEVYALLATVIRTPPPLPKVRVSASWSHSRRYSGSCSICPKGEGAEATALRQALLAGLNPHAHSVRPVNSGRES